MTYNPAVIIGLVLVVSICLFAIIAGNWRERFGGTLYLALYALGYILSRITLDYAGWRHLLPDAIGLIGFLYLCWKAPHPWPIWAVAAQLLSVTAAIASLVHGIGRWTFLTMQMVIGYGLLLALLIGTLAALQSRKKGHLEK